MRNTLILKSTKPIELFDSLDTLKILTFWQIIKDNDFTLLDVNYKKGKEYTKTQLKSIQKVWLRLYDEYYILIDDSKSKHKINKLFNELKLRDKIQQVKNNLDFLITLKKYSNLLPKEDFAKYEQEIYTNLKLIDKRIKPKYFDGIDENVKNLDRVLKSLINKYNIENKYRVKEVQKEINNVYEIVASAESWLERSIPVNDMVVSHWAAILKQVKQRQQASQKNGK